jgi:hypothetical protein
MNALAYGIKITVEENNKTYHTLNDWGYAIGNNNYIGDPEMETTYIKVPGRTGLIDASEAISGRRVYKKRSLSFELGGIEPRLSWDGVISSLRNNVDGRICRLILDNDRGYFWRGRVYIRKFDRSRDLGKFTLEIPTADPYKYDVNSSAEPWLWDPFNFETGVITQTGAETISGSGTITIQHGNMLTCPSIVVSEQISPTFTVTYDGVTFALAGGTNIIPSILVGGEDDVTLTFTGSATVQVVYRGGSL